MEALNTVYFKTKKQRHFFSGKSVLSCSPVSWKNRHKHFPSWSQLTIRWNPHTGSSLGGLIRDKYRLQSLPGGGQASVKLLLATGKDKLVTSRERCSSSRWSGIPSRLLPTPKVFQGDWWPGSLELEVGLALKRLQCLAFIVQELKEPTQHLICSCSKTVKLPRGCGVHIFSKKKKKRFAFSLNVESVNMTLNTFISTWKGWDPKSG